MTPVAEKLGIDVWSLRNGMALCKPLERAFDNSEICFFEDNTGNLVLHILEPKLCDLKVRRLPVLMNSCAASSHTWASWLPCCNAGQAPEATCFPGWLPSILSIPSRFTAFHYVILSLSLSLPSFS
jgi:hypothetical protein